MDFVAKGSFRFKAVFGLFDGFLLLATVIPNATHASTDHPQKALNDLLFRWSLLYAKGDG